jgi:DNA-binding LacI/PurR family transcriptional regulator
MSVTLKDVALRAGVSRSAVSRAFTEGASVSAKTRAKVVRAAEELGYHPNVLASSLTTGRTKLIGLVSSNFHNPIFLEVFDKFTRNLQERGFRPLLVNLTDDTEPTEAVRMLRQYSVDGVIVASSTLPQGFAVAFRQARLPVVHSFGRLRDTPDVHVVGIDNVECGRIAARELVRRGHRNIGFIGGPMSATSTQDRYQGFKDELALQQDVTTNFCFAPTYSFNAGRDEMTRLLGEGAAEAYFCADDVLSIGAMSAVQNAGLSVPEDVGIIGLNDMEMAGWDNINLTTIHQPTDCIIESSVDLIVEMLDDPSRPPTAMAHSCHVVTRGTLRPIKA